MCSNNDITLDLKGKVLKDVNDKGKEIDWRGKKLKTIDLAKSYRRLSLNVNPMFENKAFRVRDCGTYLEYKKFIDTGEKKLHQANFCKVRLCPMCAWRRSLKIFGQVSIVMDHVEENYNYKYIFLTLTVKNCYGEDLRDTLD